MCCVLKILLSFEAVQGSLADCGEAWFSTEAARSQHVLWTAPDETKCIQLAVAQATGPMDAFNTAMVRFCTLHTMLWSLRDITICDLCVDDMFAW